MMNALILSTNILLLVLGLSHSFTLTHNNNHGIVKSLLTHHYFSPSTITKASILYQSSTPTNEGDNEIDNSRIDITQDPRLYRVQISRATGIEWGTDLSFSFVYVRDMEPGGPAFMSNQISKGDQICELCPVGDDANVVPLIGASFDNVMTSFASLSKSVKDVELVFFKGTKEELIALCEGGGSSDSSRDGDSNMVTITAVVNKGSKDETIKIIKAEKGSNLRQVLVDNGVNVYQSFTRWTNCKGKQLCGTCIVDIKEGSMNTNRKSMDEGSTLRENPDSYRLSCVTFVYGDVTVETFPPIEAAQWTR